MATTVASQLLGPGTPVYRGAVWLNENPRIWLRWTARATAALALGSLAFAAVWAVVLPPGESSTTVWVWGIAAAVYFGICTGLLFINAAGRMPGWLAAVLTAGGLFTAIGVLMMFFWAVLETGSANALAVGAIVVSVVVVVPLMLALIWPMAEAMRPWLYRRVGAEHPPGRLGRD